MGLILVTGLLCNTVTQLKITSLLFYRIQGLGVVFFLFGAVALYVVSIFSSDSEYSPVPLRNHPCY